MDPVLRGDWHELHHYLPRTTFHQLPIHFQPYIWWLDRHDAGNGAAIPQCGRICGYVLVIPLLPLQEEGILEGIVIDYFEVARKNVIFATSIL